MNEEIKERHWKIVEDVLAPVATLDSVGKMYGISRERVRQIFNKRLHQSPVLIRKSLKQEHGEKMCCVVCGEALSRYRIQKGSKYCSTRCRKLYEKYDWKPARCKQCGKMFLRNRNWTHTGGSGKYCSLKCYYDRKRKQGFFTSKKPNPKKVDK